MEDAPCYTSWRFCSEVPAVDLEYFFLKISVVKKPYASNRVQGTEMHTAHRAALEGKNKAPSLLQV